MLEYIKYKIIKEYAKFKYKKIKNESLGEFLDLIEKNPPRHLKDFIFTSEIILFYIKNIRKDLKKVYYD